jgi:hypothetical protein
MKNSCFSYLFREQLTCRKELKIIWRVDVERKFELYKRTELFIFLLEFIKFVQRTNKSHTKKQLSFT